MSDDELEELRRRKLAELQQQAEAEQGQEERQHEAEAQLDNLMRQILEPEARERLTRVRMARPDVARSVERQLVALYQSGRIPHRLDDNTLRQLLARFMPKGREPTIERR